MLPAPLAIWEFCDGILIYGSTRDIKRGSTQYTSSYLFTAGIGVKGSEHQSMLSATATRKKWIASFARLLREERQLARVNIEDCPKSGNYQEECETTKRVPDLKYLIRLLMWFEYKREHQITPERLRQLLILWALAKIESYLKNKNFQKEVERDTYEEASSSLKFADVWTKYGSKVFSHLENTLIPIYEGLTESTERVSPEPPIGKLPTLEMFPDAFDPLTVVVGGRTGPPTREPERLSELFRRGQGLIDLSYLLRLGLKRNVRIIPDETLIDMPINQRTQELGRSHLLVIGSPLVNSLSRYIALKKKLIFNCVYGNDTYRWKEDLRSFQTNRIIRQSVRSANVIPHDGNTSGRD